jgi:broad specificity phosphatase PhoE
VTTDTRLAEYDFRRMGRTNPGRAVGARLLGSGAGRPRVRAAEGEAFGVAARRVSAVLQEVAARHPGSRVAVVGHGLTPAAALALLVDGDSRHAPRYALGNVGMAELT